MIILSQYSDKNVAVFGLGITGKSVINALVRSGANVYAWDDKNIPDIAWVNFAHPSTYDWSSMDALILSPGVPLKYPEPHEAVLMAQKSGCRISCDIDLLHESQPNAKFVGITGTNGKSTTTSLVHHILQNNNINSCIGGNIGIAVLDLADGADVYVLEMSSYQLDLCSRIKFDVGVLLNITPDHLDRHGNMENYIAAKKKIFGNMSVIGIDNKINNKLYEELDSEKIAFSTQRILENGISCINNQVYKNAIFALSVDQDEIILENISAAYTACSLFNIEDQKIIGSLKTFKNLPHRMEFMRKIGNITFINDSKATNAISAQQALAKYKNIYWIAGGRMKEGGVNNIDLSNVRKTFLIGEAAEEFAETLAQLDKQYIQSYALENAVKQAYKEASESNDDATILLSPACSSFDQWKNFEGRGSAFKQIVKDL